jgi:hypothetical protein
MHFNCGLTRCYSMQCSSRYSLSWRRALPPTHRCWCHRGPTVTGPPSTSTAPCSPCTWALPRISATWWWCPPPTKCPLPGRPLQPPLTLLLIGRPRCASSSRPLCLPGMATPTFFCTLVTSGWHKIHFSHSAPRVGIVHRLLHFRMRAGHRFATAHVCKDHCFVQLPLITLVPFFLTNRHCWMGREALDGLGAR